MMPSFQNPLSRSSKGSSAAPVHPTQIRNKFYKNLREFTAWQVWGTKPDHTKDNDNYIPMSNRFVKRNDYPAELQKLIDHGWKAAVTPTAPRTPAVVLGAKRATGPINLAQTGPATPLRAGFTKPRYRSGLANNWHEMKLVEQVAAYAFRGDTRPPETIMAAGGFYPPSMRTDDFYKGTIAEEFYNYMKRREGLNLDPAAKTAFKQQIISYMAGKGDSSKEFVEFHFWRQILSNEQMHLMTMTNDSFLKAYISTARDIGVARGASFGSLGGAGTVAPSSDNSMIKGFVYALRVKSGFLLKVGQGGYTKGESEIAHLGALPWKNVYGFRQIMSGEDAVYIRNSFDQEDNQAFKLVLASLSSV